ncbi:MAG: phytoene desaturase family protein [Acidimicrobiales bacterium]
MADIDAAVVGSGPNGLAAAVVLVAAGLRVRVYEGAATPGGGCRTEELTPGLRHDVCSAVHPLAAASPFFRRFGLARRGVTLLSPPVAFAHPLDGGRAGAVWGTVADTAAALGRDGAAYTAMFGALARGGLDLVDEILSPVRGPGQRPLALASFGLQAMRSAQAVAHQLRTDEARALFAGVAAHAVLPLGSPMTAGVGLLLGALAHLVGWPVVQGGSAGIVDAMVAAIEAGGGEVVTGHRVRSLEELAPARAILADLSPRGLLDLAGGQLPDGYARVMRRFRYGPGVCKVDWALSEPVPWAAPACRSAGTVHLGGSFEEVARSEADVAAGRHPSAPYVLVVQPGVVDATRFTRAAPGGAAAGPGGRLGGLQALWSYCHVPSGSERDMSGAIAAQLERFAPGFGDVVVAKVTRTASQLEAHNPNYVGGDIGGGSQGLRRALVGPALSWNPYRTPIPGLYLCSASTPPGPGVHGRCGELAALHALSDVFGIRQAPDLTSS